MTDGEEEVGASREDVQELDNLTIETSKAVVDLLQKHAASLDPTLQAVMIAMVLAKIAAGTFYSVQKTVNLDMAEKWIHSFLYDMASKMAFDDVTYDVQMLRKEG